MNSNHFDPKLVYTSKCRRIESILNDLHEADQILKELPEDIVQAIWLRVAAERLPEKTNKGKTANKGIYKRSLKKTLQCLIVFIF